MSDNGQITWTNEKRLLSALIPWPRNPRQVKVDQVRRLNEFDVDDLLDWWVVKRVALAALD